MCPPLPLTPHKAALDQLYARYARAGRFAPDPIQFLHRYRGVRDREIVGLVASSLAYGRAEQISKSVERVLARMPEPAEFVLATSEKRLMTIFADFKHRFTTGAQLAGMLTCVQRVLRRYGSLGECFASGLDPRHENVVPALEAFVDTLTGGRRSYLLPSPSRGSACKRLNLYLRWMVREDAVDPGGWDRAPRSKLVVPLDTHMHRIGLALRATARKQANLKAALDITAAFRRIAPSDPVRYDFALTRLGILPEGDLDAFLRKCGAGRGGSHG